ncbi:MAG TPA: flagellar basal body P-ring formation chaperone FlgA [Tepidisphaeraceae bacterium]|jgi:flagella basal body P-ring formation protein FlgA|nr:flagellar basal body P-ring formation chaperone FlgA [Tepidisphaeraceae bacterium]
MNNRRLGKQKQVQLLVVLTLLAWATQTLLHQWGYGQEVAPPAPSDQPAPAPSDFTGDEKFVPSDSIGSPAGILELRQEASISGADVTLKQVCRWSDSDAAVFTPIADLTLVHLTGQVSFRTITIDDIRQTLHDSGVNIAMINFSGATSCNVTRSDAQVNPQQSLQQWIDSQQPAAPKAANRPAPVPTAAAPDPTFHTLRELLASDLAQRLNIDPEQLQLTFSPENDKVLSLAEPIFKFDVRPSRARALGNVSWDVTVFAGPSSKKMTIPAVARAWENQLIVARPLAAHQILAATDFALHRALVDSIPDHQPLRMDQCVGEQAAEDLRPGVVMTAMLVDPVPLVRSGQLVTVTLTHGTVQLRSVARAMEQGTRGQTIRVRNENSRDVLYVVVTGPQEARFDEPATSDLVSQAN